jgi:tRNA (guanine-N7-)-methyltransferase
MRKKKNGEERLLAVREFLLDIPENPQSDPAALIGMPGAPVYLEIGAGKGGFACAMAEKNPNVAFFAMEKVSDCVVLACERASKLKSEGRDNLRFIIENADRLSKIFEMGTVDGIFLNFSDPWSKSGYAKRRLTHRRYLALYLNLLKDGGKITFKTDNDGLFDFSLEEIYAMGLTTTKITRDLHNSEYADGNVMTEYERNFTEKGKSINMLEIEKPENYEVKISREFLPDFDRTVFFKK